MREKCRAARPSQLSIPALNFTLRSRGLVDGNSRFCLFSTHHVADSRWHFADLISLAESTQTSHSARRQNIYVVNPNQLVCCPTMRPSCTSELKFAKVSKKFTAADCWQSSKPVRNHHKKLRTDGSSSTSYTVRFCGAAGGISCGGPAAAGGNAEV